MMDKIKTIAQKIASWYQALPVSAQIGVTAVVAFAAGYVYRGL